MRKEVVPAVAIAMTIPAILSAQSDDIPNLDVQPVCRGIASQSGDPLEAGLQASFAQCVQGEQAVHEQLKKVWPTFSPADKRHCVTLAKIGGESSYTELLTCLEMARDVRAYRSAAPEKATTRNRSSSSLSSLYLSTRAPSSPSTSSPSTSSPPTSSPSMASAPTNEPSTTIVKELQQAKVAALNARTSESLAQRKLADAEVDLKQAKDEAAQAGKEAEQARADAQAARQAQIQAESKLADSEAARKAAEGGEQACQSAAKGQPGLGAFGGWLRGLFGPSSLEKP